MWKPWAHQRFVLNAKMGFYDRSLEMSPRKLGPPSPAREGGRALPWVWAVHVSARDRLVAVRGAGLQVKETAHRLLSRSLTASEEVPLSVAVGGSWRRAIRWRAHGPRKAPMRKHLRKTLGIYG